MTQITEPPQETDYQRRREQQLIRRARGLINFRFFQEFAIGWLHAELPESGLSPTAFGMACELSPEARGRKPAMSYAKVGSIVFGPQLPDGSGESIYRIENRKGKKQRLICLRDGRGERSEVGDTFRWHADDNMVVFGRAHRGEIVRLRNQGIQ